MSNFFLRYLAVFFITVLSACSYKPIFSENNYNFEINEIIFNTFKSILINLKINSETCSVNIVAQIRPIKKPKNDATSLKKPLKNPLINAKERKQIMTISKLVMFLMMVI